MVAAGVLSAVAGILLIWGAASFRGDDPTAISDPWSVVLFVTAGTFLVVAVLALLPDRAPADDRGRLLPLAAVLVGAASMFVFLLLVPGRAQLCCADHTLSTIARVLPPILGVAAIGLGLWALADARGKARRVRGSLAAIAMGACSALVPLWLWTGYCNLFESGC